MIETTSDFRSAVIALTNNVVPERVLFRGQKDSGWDIQSSLERHGTPSIECGEYYRKIDRYKPLINPLVSTRYERKCGGTGYQFDFTDYEPASWELPEMEYLTYLRHHGFPTPLIDVTQSCYVALFFACEDFNQPDERYRKDGKVWVYMPPALVVQGNGIPELRVIGRYVEGGRRHFAQQSQYITPIKHSGEWMFIPFADAKKRPGYAEAFRDITICKNVKGKLMKELNEMNINRYTMYQDEDSLIKSCADDWALELHSKAFEGASRIKS